jgi:hypothetical protein
MGLKGQFGLDGVQESCRFSGSNQRDLTMILVSMGKRHLTGTPMEVTKMMEKIKDVVTTVVEMFILALFCLMVVVI